MGNPLISVIVPVYKVEAYLRRCVDSILNQTYSNLEVILVDDGSPDRCGQICDDYLASDVRVRVVHKENAGLGFARNSGLDICRGEYVLFVDSDDYLPNTSVQILYERMAADNSDMAQGNHTAVFEAVEEPDDYCRWMMNEVVTGQELLDRMVSQVHIPVSAWGKLYKREVFSGLRYPALKCAEDLWIYPDILKKCRYISCVDENVYFYFQRSTSILHQMSEIAKHHELDATMHMVEFLLQKGLRKSAQCWYARGVSKARDFQDQRLAIDLIFQYFHFGERLLLMIGQPFKIILRWFALRSQVFDRVYRAVKRLIQGK